MKAAYLLRGDEFLADEALQRVRQETETDPLAETYFDAGIETAVLMNALGTPSLLGGRRLVVVREANDLKKDAVEALQSYLASPSPDVVLVLVARSRSKLDDAVKDVGAVISLDPPKGRALVGWLRERARQHQVMIDDRGAWALIDAVGPELRDLDAALQQLATGMGPQARVTAADVRERLPRLADERVYVFTDAVGERRPAVAMAALRRLLEQGDHPLVVFGALTSQVRRMLQARAYVEQGAKAVADAVGLPGWRAERLARQARSYREEELVAALDVLARTDVELKGGDLPQEAALERAVLQIVSGPVSRRFV